MSQADECLDNNIKSRHDEEWNIEDPDDDQHLIQQRRHTFLSSEEGPQQHLGIVFMQKDDDGEDCQQ